MSEHIFRTHTQHIRHILYPKAIAKAKQTEWKLWNITPVCVSAINYHQLYNYVHDFVKYKYKIITIILSKYPVLYQA